MFQNFHGLTNEQLKSQQKSIVATGVNLGTEVEKLNMATKFVALVIALALLVIASSVGKLPGEKSLFSQRKNPRQLMFAEEES